MAGTTNTARDAPALFDPEPASQGSNDGGRRRRHQVTLDDLRAYHRVGRALVEGAIRAGRRQAAAAAVEVFRSALEHGARDVSLRNGMGAALLERARLEPGLEAVATLKEAMQAFRAASALAARQAVPRAAGLRYEINAATAAWMLGERTEDTECLNQAVSSLRSAAAELSEASPHWSHVQDNLGNALMALARTEEAIRAYQAALGGRPADIERGRSLNNLGTAYAAQGRYAEACLTYREALLLQPRDQVPLGWARTQHNLANALLQEALASDPSPLVGRQLGQSIEAFEAARDLRRRERTPLDWGVTTANLAGAYLGLGAHLCARKVRPDRRSGANHIRRAIELYNESLPELPPADVPGTIRNIAIAVRALGKASDRGQAAAEVHRRRTALLSLAAHYGLAELVDQVRQDDLERRPSVPRPRQTAAAMAPAPPAGLQWPTESYTQAYNTRGENIEAFLSRVWLPLIKAGVVDLPTLRAKDPSAAKAIDNFTRKTDPLTGQRRRLAPQLHIPTKKELNDKLAANIDDPGDRPARLDWALRARARRAVQRK